MEKTAKSFSGINGRTENMVMLSLHSQHLVLFLLFNHCCSCFKIVVILNLSFPVLREQYYMVQKLGGGGFGTVYMVQVTFSSVFWSFFLGNIEIDSQRKTNKEMFAAKHQKHTRPDDVAYARNELEILNKVSSATKVQLR